jgi:hypothetical protein
LMKAIGIVSFKASITSGGDQAAVAEGTST